MTCVGRGARGRGRGAGACQPPSGLHGQPHAATRERDGGARRQHGCGAQRPAGPRSVWRRACEQNHRGSELPPFVRICLGICASDTGGPIPAPTAGAGPRSSWTMKATGLTEALPPQCRASSGPRTTVTVL